MYKEQLKTITDDINKRMKGYHSSLQPTNDEVTIAWLIMTIKELEAKAEHLDQFSTFLLNPTPDAFQADGIDVNELERIC